MSLCPVCGKNEIGEVEGGTWLPVCESCQNKPIEYIEKKETKVERQPSISEDLVEMHRLFTQTLDVEPKVIYYPSCDVDASPVAGFPNSQVFFVDINPEAIAILKKSGFQAECADVNNFVLAESADVVILLNPVVSPDGPIKNLKIGGHVLCNDWHKTATKMRDRKDFKLVGIINRPNNVKQTKAVFDKNNLELYWQRVETEKEFEIADPDFYSYAKGKIDKKLGVGHSVLENVRKVLGLGLPSKNGHLVDDLFIFEKVGDEKEPESID